MPNYTVVFIIPNAQFSLFYIIPFSTRITIYFNYKTPFLLNLFGFLL